MRLTLLLIAGAGVAIAQPTAGAAETGLVSIRYFTKVPAGQTPRVEFLAREALGGLRVNLQRDDGTQVQKSFGATGKGQTQVLPLEALVGRHRYEGQILVQQAAHEQASSISFDTQVAAELTVHIDRRQVDLAAGRLTLVPSRDLAQVELTVHAASGAKPQVVRHEVKQASAGRPLQLSFPGGDSVARIDVKATDVDGFFTTLSFLPWSLSIPHEEVNFGTDQSQVAAVEQRKLDASLVLIKQALTRASSLGAVSLFIAGHTDTVGHDTHNLTLSLARAQAIAQYFRKRGLRMPILFEGFGEKALAVATADQVDEARNRRVDYILALEPPVISGPDFSARWRKLP